MTPTGDIVNPGNDLTVTWLTAGKVVKLDLSGSNTLQVAGYCIGEDAFPCRPEQTADYKKVVRSVVGPSRSTLNTGIYCRQWDWVVICSSSVDREFICDSTDSDNREHFTVTATGSPVKVTLKSSYFMENREGRVYENPGIPGDKLWHFKPWEFKVHPRVPVGWISWRAYGAGITENNVHDIVEHFDSKNMKDFEFEYFVLDDGWFYGSDGGGFYQAPTDIDWTRAHPTRFPSGVDALIDHVHDKGYKIGLWMSPFGFSGNPNTNPSWWIRASAGGSFFVSPKGWHGKYYADGTTTEALTGWLLKGPIAMSQKGFDYLKVDGTLHVCYEAYMECGNYFQSKGYTWQEACRKAYSEIRKAIGDTTFYSQCWSRTPVTIGYCDAMRVGGDMGSGWTSWALQAGLMYTWNYENNIAWIVDPDHMVMYGSTPDEFRLMSTVTSMTGSLLLYSDKPDQYPDSKMEVIKRVCPQIGYPAPRSGDLFKKTGTTAALWTLEISRPFENWMIVANTDFNSTKVTTLKFDELGLDTTKSYTVYDFWNGEYKGVFKSSYYCGAPGSHGVKLYGLREIRPHPWIISTSRHITQGGVDLINVTYDVNAKKIIGTSKAVKNDPYMITLYVPDTWEFVSAEFGGTAATVGSDNGATTIKFSPSANGEVNWSATFSGGTGLIEQGQVDPVMPDIVPLQVIAKKGVVRLQGSYPGSYRITLYSPSGRVIKELGVSAQLIIENLFALRV